MKLSYCLETLQHVYYAHDNWKDRAELYTDMTGHRVSAKRLKDQYSRYNRQGKLKEFAKPKEGNKKIVHNEDGSVDIINVMEMHYKYTKDFNYILEAHGFIPAENYTLSNLVLNEWGSKTDAGLVNYQVKFKVNEKTLSDFTLDDVAFALKDFTYKHRKIDIMDFDGDHILAARFTDMHIGDEGTEPNEYLEISERIKKDIIKNKYSSLQLDFLGDILHVDTFGKTTTKGTQLEMKYSPYDMYLEAVEIVIGMIDRLAIIPTSIRWVQGNHSRVLEFALFNRIAYAFKDHKHIKFDVDETSRKAYMVHNTLVGIYHGDLPKQMEDKWLQYEFANLWGQANSWETYSGHYHEKHTRMSGGLEMNTLGTKNKAGNYAKSLGYGSYSTKVETCAYCPIRGKFRIELY